MGRKKSKKNVQQTESPAVPSDHESLVSLPVLPSVLPVVESTRHTPCSAQVRDIQVEAMDAIMESLLSNKNLQNAIKEKQQRGVGASVFNSEKLNQNQFANDGDDENIEYIVQQRVIFQSFACHICKALTSDDNSPLKRCLNCKMIAYCSREHQIEHWPIHKDLCKVICKICKRDGVKHLYEKAVGLTPEMYRHFRIQCVNECTQVLGRQMELWEREMFYYTSVCQTCFQVDRNQLTTCAKCLHINYCELEHLHKNHEKWCEAFRMYRDIIFYQAENGMIQPVLPNKIFTKFIPLSGGIRQYLLETFGSRVCMQWNRITFPVLTDVASCPLTTLFALQHCQLKPETKDHLTIHMVGAELHFEADTISKWEIFFLHLLPKLKTLHVVFVGPELQDRPKEMIGDEKCCRKCRETERKVIYEFHSRCFYHDYINLPSYRKPDMICAFNAGLYRTTGFDGTDTWPPSIKCMLKDPNVPMVVTAYTSHELPQDVQRMKDHCPAHLKLILPPTENPFSSRKPSLNFIDEEEVPVIFKNFYIAIARTVK